MTAAWMDDARRLDLRDLLPRLGGETRGGRRGRTGPCPSCGAADVRVYAAREGWQRWQCYRCSQGGDAVDAVAWSVVGARYAGQEEVRSWLGGAAPETVRRAPPEPPPSYPPRAQVLDLLSRCRSGGEGEAWAASRGAAAVPPGCLGTLPLEAADGRGWPGWAMLGNRSWCETGHRYVVPLCDARGVIRSVRARRPDEGQGAKAVPPTGYSVRGLWMASRWGRQQLAAGAWAGLVALVEGEPAWLAGVARWEPAGVLVLGFFAGSATDATRAALSAARPVLVAVDDDDAGRGYVAGWMAGGLALRTTTAKDDPNGWSGTFG